MKKKMFFALTVGLCITFVNCSNSDSTEENENSSEQVSEDIAADTDQEQEQQISEDLDNATFKQYWKEKGGILIDVRTPAEVENGAIDGAININYSNGDFEAALDTLDATVPTFVYCQGGTRSGKARDLLVKKGFSEVYNLTNGYGNWED